MNRRKVFLWMMGIVLVTVGIIGGYYAFGIITYTETVFAPNAEVGSNNLNIAYGGFVAESGDWIYYRNHSDNDWLYKVKKDGTQKTKVFEDRAENINVIGDWIYYTNYYNYDCMYKVKTDGTGRTQVVGDMTSFITIKGDWIYYISLGTDISGADYQLRKMKVDGKKKASLVKMNHLKTQMQYINITDDAIYFVLRSSRNWLYKTDLEGDDMQIVNKERTYLTSIADGWIYYINGSEDFKLYRMKTDGSSRAKLTDSPVHHYNMKDGWIYYANEAEEGKLYKMKLDGSEKTALPANISFGGISIAGDWIYYQTDKYGTTYRVRIDGTGVEEVK